MLKNFQKLFSANIVAGLLGLVTLTLVSRELGPAPFGIIAVIVSLGAFVEQIASFQAWQAVTKYAAEFINKQDRDGLWHVVSLGLLLDIIGSLTAAVIGGLAILSFGEWVGVGGDHRSIAFIYMLSLALNVSGTATAVLRTFEHYDSISRVLVSMSALKLAVVAACLGVGLSIGLVMAIFIAVNVLQSAAFVRLLLRLCREQGASIRLTGIRIRDFRNIVGLTRFVVSTNLSSTVRQIVHELDVVLLSAMTSPSVAGQYKLAKQYGSVVLRVVEPAQQVVFPRIAELVAAERLDTLAVLVRKLIVVGAALAAITIVGYVAVGKVVVQTLLGSEYDLVPAFLQVFVVAIGLFAGLFFLRPLALSFGRADAILVIYVISTIIFMFVYYGLFGRLGAISMMYAQIGFYGFWAIGMTATVLSAWRSRITRQTDLA